MKHFLLLFCAISFLISSSAPANITPEMDNIIAALRSGNATQLAKYFDTRVDISLPGKSDNYSRKQAEMIMRDFFSINSVRSFQVKHTGENKDGSQYCTGTLQTKNGNYRTTLFMRKKGDKQLLQQVTFQLME